MPHNTIAPPPRPLVHPMSEREMSYFLCVSPTPCAHELLEPWTRKSFCPIQISCRSRDGTTAKISLEVSTVKGKEDMEVSPEGIEEQAT